MFFQHFILMNYKQVLGAMAQQERRCQAACQPGFNPGSHFPSCPLTSAPTQWHVCIPTTHTTNPNVDPCKQM